MKDYNVNIKRIIQIMNVFKAFEQELWDYKENERIIATAQLTQIYFMNKEEWEDHV